MSRLRLSSLTLLLLSSLHLPQTQAAPAQTCACGYIDDHGNIWRESLTTDFTQSTGALAALGNDWIIATDNEPQGTGIAIQYVDGNVLEWDDALGLRASAYDNSGSVKSAEIFTTRSDILYGTFRMRAVVPSVPGVVFGFFTYISDTQEQDIEFLSSDSDYYQHVYYTDQPGNVNGVPDTNAYKDVEVNGADFTAFGEHRIDWLTGATNYFYNSAQTATITKNVPTTPSEIILNVWSNGDPEYSKGPPTADAIAVVQYVKFYFNSTSLSEGSFESGCRDAGSVARCSV